MCEKEGRSPLESWELWRLGIGISVHKFLGEGGKWFVSCARVGLRSYDLETHDLETAKELAVELVISESAKQVDEVKLLHECLVSYKNSKELVDKDNLTLHKDTICKRNDDGDAIWGFTVESSILSDKQRQDIAQALYNELLK